MLMVKNTLLDGGVDTPLGNVLRVSENAQWLTYLMYAVPYISVNLPPISSVACSKMDKITFIEMENFAAAIMSERSAVKQLEEVGMEEAFFLAIKTVDKLAIAAYTLYLYGSKRK